MPKSNWTKSSVPVSVNAITSPIGAGGSGTTWKNKFADQVMADVPIGYWRFNDEYGASGYSDSSGNGNFLTPVNGSLFPAEGGLLGDINRGMFCPGGNGSPACNFPPSILSSWPATQDFSVLCLLKIVGGPSGSGYNKIISIGTASGADNDLIEISVAAGGVGKIRATICDGSGGIVVQAEKQIWLPYSWLHICVTHSATAMCTYLQGSLIASTASSYTVPILSRPYGGVLQSPREVCPLPCIIDELAIFNSCLSASRAAELYQYAAGRQS